VIEQYMAMVADLGSLAIFLGQVPWLRSVQFPQFFSITLEQLPRQPYPK